MPNEVCGFEWWPIVLFILVVTIMYDSIVLSVYIGNIYSRQKNIDKQSQWD